MVLVGVNVFFVNDVDISKICVVSKIVIVDEMVLVYVVV